MRSLMLLSIPFLTPVTLAAPAVAQEDPAPIDDGNDDDEPMEDDEILVTATRIYGQVVAPQPPVMTLDEEDIQSYGVSSIDDLITALAPQTGSGRGRGDGRPVMLVNGQRISNFREFRNIPPEAIRRMEILPEEVALRYGYPANQRVINFILKEHFASRSIDAEYNFPAAGGFAEPEFEATWVQIDKANRLNINVQAKDSSMLTEAERKIIQQGDESGASRVAGDPDPAEFRSLVSDSRDLTLTGSWSTGIGQGAGGGSLSLNAQIGRTDSRSLSGFNSVLLSDGTDQTLRTFGDPLGRTSRTVTAQGGASFNKGLGTWQLSATLDASHAETQTRIDRRFGDAALADLQAQALAGSLQIDDALPDLGNPGRDLAITRNRSLTSLVTLSGSAFRLPAGDVSVTVKGGFGYTGIRSTDTRNAGIPTRLNRGDLNTGVNIGLPIASRRDEVLSAIGDLSLNFSAGLNRLSDFGTLTDWSAGFNWSPIDKLDFQVSYLVNEAAPSLGDLGNPVIENYNVPAYDFATGETVLITTRSGGNPALKRETQRDLKIGANWELPVLKNSNLVVEYFRNRSSDVTQAFPLLTSEIEGVFPDRVERDENGRLVLIDRRSVTFAQAKGSRLRYGFNVSGTIGKPQPGGDRGMGFPRGPGGGGPRMAGGPGGPGGRGPRMGRGPGGPGPLGGAGNGQGRWNLSVFHTVRFDETVLIAPGIPELDLLGGDALTDGGVARHSLEFEGGVFHKGLGLRMNGNWTAPTHASDLRFGTVFDVDLRVFVNFDQKKQIVEAVPLLRGSRLSFEVKNLFNSIQKVTDDTGVVPLSYQRGYVDPRGRFLGVDFRKTF